MNQEPNIETELVGPRSDAREDRQVDEYHSKNGEALWMALIPEEETLVLDSHTVYEAKNKLIEMINNHPEEIKMCSQKTTEECREILQQFANAA